MSKTLPRRPCCGNCVFFHKDTLGTVEWEAGEQIVIGNYCVLRDFEKAGEELRVIGDGERNADGICVWYERNVIE